MHNFKIYIITLFIGLSAINVSAQTYQDSLQMAVKYRESGKLKECINMLSIIYKAHPTDLNTTWYYAQSSYLAGDFHLSYWLYEAAIKIQPANLLIQLDYSKTLVNTGELDKAEWMLNSIVKKDGENAEAWFYLGKVYYWQGRFTESENLLQNLALNAPGKTDAEILLSQLHGDIAPWLLIQTSLNHDDQPLNILNPVIKGGWYHSSLLSLDFELKVPLALAEDKTFFMQGFKVGNTFYFRKIATKVYLSAGVFNFATKKKLNTTGDFRIEKTLFNKLIIATDIHRNPYYFTRGSLDTVLMENHFAASAEWNDPDQWNGKMSFEHDIFSSDQHTVSAVSGWIFVPVIKWGKFNFHFGYGFNYSNSDINHFSSAKTIEDIVSSGNLTDKIKGVYNPYFTPKEQQIHSLLAVVGAQITRKLSFKISGNVGVFAKTLYPYLYLQKDQDGYYSIVRGFESTTFTPFEIKTRLDLELSKTILFSTDLNYFHTIYYSGEMIQLNLRKRF